MSKRLVAAAVGLVGVVVVIVVVASGGGQAGSPSRLISCIEKRGWRRQTKPFTIQNARQMHLASDWNGGPGSYVEVLSMTPGRPFQLVAVSEKLGEADEARLLREVQAHPGRFEAVLVAEHPREGSSREVGREVVNCSYEVYPNQGP
jgi:hypothetical protein